jgi:hypothetical protein
MVNFTDEPHMGKPADVTTVQFTTTAFYFRNAFTLLMIHNNLPVLVRTIRVTVLSS